MLNNPRILVVDDEPGMRDIMKRALISRLPGAGVYALSSGRRVLEIAALWRPQVIVLDWVLGQGKTGLSLCREIKSRPATRMVSILVVSGRHTEESDGLKGYSCGGDAFLPKPFSLSRFTGYVQALLNKSAVIRGPGSDVAQAGPWLLDRKERRLISEESGSSRLPRTLFELLWILAKRHPRSVPVIDLIRHVWNNRVRDSQAAVAVLRLKRRLNPKDGAIESVPKGYHLVFPR